jgi:predicted amidohydrolase
MTESWEIMNKQILFALAATTVMALTATPSSAQSQGCKNGSSPHWYAFAAASSSENQAYNIAGSLGETQVQHIKRTNSPNNRKNLWLVYRGWFNSKAEASRELPYFKRNGFGDAYVKELCMW